MDVDKGEIIGEIANTPGVHGIALAPKSGKGFTSNGQDGTSTIFDLKTLKELDRVKVGSRPDGIIYDPASERIFTFNAGSKDATAIDAESGKVAGSVPLGARNDLPSDEPVSGQHPAIGLAHAPPAGQHSARTGGDAAAHSRGRRQ